MTTNDSPSDVVDHQCTGSAPVVATRDCAESFLPGRVPDLQFDLLPRHLNDPKQIWTATCLLVVCVSQQHARGALLGMLTSVALLMNDFIDGS